MAIASASGVPPAFLCQMTHRVMEDPTMALCSHLFERRVFSGGEARCPIDKTPLLPGEGVPFEELKKKIQLWKNGLREESLSQEAAVSSSATVEKVQKKLSLLGLKKSGASTSQSTGPKLTHTIPNAHQDDIHGLTRLGPHRFLPTPYLMNIHLF